MKRSRTLVVASLAVVAVATTPRARAQQDPAVEPVAAAESEPVAATESEPVAVAESEPVAVAESEPVAVTAAESEPVAVTATESEPMSEPMSEPIAAPVVSRPRAIEDLRLGREDSGLGNALWLSGGVFGGDVRNDSVIASTIDLGIRLALARDARVSLDWGVAIAETRVRGAYTSPTTVEEFDTEHTRVEARNADLALEWVPFVSSDVRVGVGAGVAIPVAATTRLPSDAQTQSLLDASSLVHEAYLAANGGVYAWRYRPERVAVYLPVSLSISLGPDTALSFEGAAALGVRVLGNLGPELLGDVVLAADLGTSFFPQLRMGVRASAAGLDLGTATSAVQPAVAAWSRIELAPVSILLRADVGLGGPYGVGSSFAGWGLHAGASVAL